jgi:hypothetical protein
VAAAACNNNTKSNTTDRSASSRGFYCFFLPSIGVSDEQSLAELKESAQCVGGDGGGCMKNNTKSNTAGRCWLESKQPRASQVVSSIGVSVKQSLPELKESAQSVGGGGGGCKQHRK